MNTNPLSVHSVPLKLAVACAGRETVADVDRTCQCDIASALVAGPHFSPGGVEY
ncbi:MAG: hypothetical protein WBO73_04150 [Gammaproteobacteria bacterium]